MQRLRVNSHQAACYKLYVRTISVASLFYIIVHGTRVEDWPVIYSAALALFTRNIALTSIINFRHFHSFLASYSKIPTLYFDFERFLPGPVDSLDPGRNHLK